MIGRQLGPYSIEAELGTGGMGTVYRATGPKGQVALKVVHPHLLATPGFFKRFLREGEIGRQIRHPNVVRTFDADAIELDRRVVHYLVMEYVEGQTLRCYLRDLGRVPETILREIALQVAAGLVAIHARGIVHRDLKPENILITDDHEVRIMDLGVARLLEATLTLTSAGQIAGSLLYGAPEQFMGEAVGPTADLYSIGVALYELATGEHPFSRGNEAAVIEAHLRHEPPPPVERNPELTPYFSELISKLIAKEPADRFASAEDLHAALEDGERSGWWASHQPAVRKVVRAVPTIRIRRETSLHGRQEAMETLQRAWADAKRGRGGAVLVEGEAGIGKTRILDAFAQSLEEEEVAVLYGSYSPSGGSCGISAAILDEFGGPGLSSSLAPYLKVTPSLVPGFAALLTHDLPGRGADPLPWDAFVAVCVHLMQAMAKEKPLLWLVDDLHFAPKESRDLVLTMARAVTGRPVLLVVTARPGLPDEELAHFGRLEGFVRIPLRRLGAREVVQLLRSALHSDTLARKLGGIIAYKSDGVPFFIFEMIRSLEQGRFIRPLPDGSYEQTRVIEEIEVPSAVKDLIGGRLRALSQDQREILDVGSVQGLSFDPALVARVLGKKKVHVLQDIAQIGLQSGLVHGLAGSVVFDQHQIQEVLYGSLIPDLSKEYHTLLADAYADRAGDEPTAADSVFLASHYLQGSAPERGAAHVMPALGRLASLFRNEELIALAGRALEREDLLDSRDRVAVLLHAARHQGLLGRREQERASLTEAAAVADGTGEAKLRAEAGVYLARHLFEISRIQDAFETAGSARDLAIEAGDRNTEARAVDRMGVSLLRLGRYEESRPYFERRLQIAREDEDLRGEAIARGNLGLLAKALGRFAEARSQFERQQEIGQATGNRQVLSISIGNLGTVCKVVGRFEEARALFQRHRELSRGIGDRMGEANAAGNLGLVLKNLGQFDEARALFEENLEISREIGNRLGEATATGNLGLVFKSLGHYEEARVHFERSRELAAEIGDRHGEAISTGNVGNVLFDLGRYQEALQHYETWRETSSEIGDRHGEAVAMGNLGNALAALGRYEPAREHFEQSRRIARAIGDREGEAVALSDLGALHARLGDPGSGRSLVERSLIIFRELGARRSEGHALHGIATIATLEGDCGTAMLRFQEALEVHRAIRHPGGQAETELAIGRLHADLGDLDAARRTLESALVRARELDLPSVLVPAACQLASLDGFEVPAAEALLTRYETRLSIATAMESRYLLWVATQDGRHLAQARHHLDALRAGAPEVRRDAMIENVALHRDIMRARDAT